MALHYHFTTKIFLGSKIMLRIQLGIEQHYRVVRACARVMLEFKAVHTGSVLHY